MVESAPVHGDPKLRERSRTRIAAMAASLSGVSEFLEVVAILVGIVGVIGGVVVARQHVVLGVSIVAGVIVTQLFYWAVARGLRLIAEFSSYSVDAPIHGGVERLPWHRRGWTN